MKSKIKKMMLITIILWGCWCIGQYRLTKNGGKVDGAVSESNFGIWNTAIFDGNQKTDDTPWNITAGWVEMENGEESILLMPNTAVTFELADNESFSFLYQIHPWVKEGSDGAGLVFQGYNAERNVVYEDEIAIDNRGDWLGYVFDRKAFPEIVSVKLSCNNGNNDDDNCDWVILKEADNSIANEESISSDIFTLAYSNSMPEEAGYSLINWETAPVLEREIAWEFSDILNPSVIKWNGKYYNYYSGFDGETWRTGLAISDDGKKWVKSNKNPVLDLRIDGWDNSYIAANGSAIIVDNQVYYFYQGLIEKEKAAIGLAVSENGEDFIRRTETPVLEPGGGVLTIGMQWG